jgi:plastocyanin
MKRLIILFTSIAILAGAFAFGLTYTNQSKNVGAANTAVQVDLIDNRAEPSAVSVEKGKHVQFNTKDGKTHNIGQGGGEAGTHAVNPAVPGNGHPEGDASTDHQHATSEAHDHTAGTKVSGDFGRDQAYRVQFNETGTYTFHDHLNPKISVVIVVYDPAKK